VRVCGLGDLDFGFQILDFGFWVWVLGVLGLGFRVLEDSRLWSCNVGLLRLGLKVIRVLGFAIYAPWFGGYSIGFWDWRSA
jgi:hypothetical protein